MTKYIFTIVITTLLISCESSNKDYKFLITKNNVLYNTKQFGDLSDVNTDLDAIKNYLKILKETNAALIIAGCKDANINNFTILYDSAREIGFKDQEMTIVSPDNDERC